MHVTLEIPDSIDYQLVYRVERDKPFEVTLGSTFTFKMLDSVRDAWTWRKAITHALGPLGAVVAAAKLATGSRRLYLVLQEDKPVSHGWGTVGRCRHYKVEPESVVIGPISTDPQMRGQGLATLALQAAINDYVRRGQKVFYIDTSKTNVSAQRVFQKCGFGEPVSLYFR